MQRYIWLLAVTLVSPGSDGWIGSQTLRREPPVQIFATLGLTPEQVSAVDAGRPVAKVLSWGTPSEVYVFGAVRRYVLEYPNAALPGADSYFFWEKVDFGLKPTIRLNHAVIYRGRTQGRDFATVAIKQLYATHYFHTALDVSVCVQDGARDRPGFYLLTLKGSQQDGLTGVTGSLLRKAVVDRTRTSLERALASIKQTVEHSAAGG